MEVFLTTGQRIALISCVVMWLCAFWRIYLILSKCGVSRRLFQSRSYHNLLLDRRKLAPHFLCIYTNPTAIGVVTVIAHHLKQLKYYKVNTIFDTEDGNVIIPEGTVNIESINFNYRQFKSVVIPDSVTKIEHCAFESCSLLESVAIPESVNTISAGAFYNCKSLKSINIPNSVTEISNGTFKGCSSLESITIPDSVTKIGLAAFAACTSLESITIPK